MYKMLERQQEQTARLVKEQIISTLRATNRENIEQVINYMEHNGFFTRGCHSHHHYVGGLADHAWQTYQFALKADKEYCESHANAQSVGRDSLAICTILHDFCNCHGMHHLHHHGSRSAGMLKELGFHLSIDEWLAIRFHMSLSSHKDHPCYENASRCRLRLLVHTADGKSAGMNRGSNIEKN